MGDWLSDNKWRLTLEQFQAFYEDRPEHEKWELIEEVPVMMPPPSRTHQRVSSNLETLINTRCGVVRPEWRADREIGLLVPDDKEWNPEPDVTVVDCEYEPGEIYAPRFYMVAEVLSPNDRPAVLAAKRTWYKAHDHCLAVLFVEQERVALEMESRERAGGTWVERELTAPDAVIDLPVLGTIGRLADLYTHTPLAVH